MTAHITGGLTVDLDNGPVRTRYDRDANGKQRATLIIGEGSDAFGITVTDSGPELLDQLQEAVSELRAWAALQERIKTSPEVER
ncbi:hypothetical protein [Streptomyces huasconensis]|uniref:hypothetical protein n=1 Tax=Streptomyces huasconensis TaxID=1854574 RepID=UPI0036FEB9C6